MKLSHSNRSALFISSAALAVALAGVGGPVVAKAFDADNADKVDGKHAVSAGATVTQRKGKLVATSGTTGKLPTNIMDAKAFFPTKVPLGGQLSGYWRIDVQSVAGDTGDWHEAVSFGARMPEDLTVEMIKEFPSTSDNCSGTVDTPTARPGYFCVYLWYATGNVNQSSIGAYMDGKYGGAVHFNTGAAGGDAYAAGTWTARAPLSLAPRAPRSSRVSPGMK